ncbi:MAG: hypothetical protein GQ569_08480 [Methylococcaceae bacterium]|nr:hypothetical protein [Methylococcaceae bacterium]
MKEVASLRYGVIFKKAFCDVEIFTGFVRDTLGITLEIDKVETEKTFDTPVGKVQPRFDLYAEDKKNRIIVDIQHERHTDHYDRFLHYHCVALLEQIKNSSSYRPNLSVYTIVVLTSGDKHKKDVLVSNFDPCDLEGNYINAIPHKIIFLCPKYANENTPEPLKEWMRAIDDSLDGQVDETEYHLPEILKIFSHIERDDISPVEKARMIDEYNFEELKQTQFDNGLKEGEEKGKITEKLTMATTMLKEGFDINTIAKITGLNEERILELKK